MLPSSLTTVPDPSPSSSTRTAPSPLLSHPPRGFRHRQVFSSSPSPTLLPSAGALPSGLPLSSSLGAVAPSLSLTSPVSPFPLPLAAASTAVADVGLLSDHHPRPITVLHRPDRALTTAVPSSSRVPLPLGFLISTAGDSAAASRCPPFRMMPPRDWPPRGWEVDGKELAFIREVHRVQAERVKLKDVGKGGGGLVREAGDLCLEWYEVFLKQYKQYRGVLE